uniref:Integrase catalytic domain-containing protein n=1 Tax=Mastacembelus armatus TaxID=205130 RepID=A0A3Q3L9J3_9TELE
LSLIKQASLNRWDNLYKFISLGSYPDGYNKSQKLNLRRHASKFTVKDGDLFFEKRRAIKTKEEARKLFREFHSSPYGGHSGILKTRTAMCSRFYWLIFCVLNHCEKSQKTFDCCTAVRVCAPWDFLGIDLTGPLSKTADGFQYILTATDYFSKWVEAFPLKTKLAAEVGRHICSIIYRHGCPKRILSDQGREFVNEVRAFWIERSVTVAYHPQTNSLDEITNHNIKRALTKLVNEKQNTWDVYLDATLFSLRSKVHTTTKYSPFLLMYGREVVFPSKVPKQQAAILFVRTDRQKREITERRSESGNRRLPLRENRRGTKEWRNPPPCYQERKKPQQNDKTPEEGKPSR